MYEFESPYAEDLNYWKTSKLAPGAWLDKTEKLIEGFGGLVQVSARGRNEGQVAFLIEFSFPPHRFKLIWPVLESKNGDQHAAERQAATMTYHDVKSRSLRLAIHGPRLAFFEFLMLPSGYTVGQLEIPELVAHLPEALQSKQLRP